MAGITEIAAGNMCRGFGRFRNNPVVTTRTCHRTGKFVVIHLHRRHPSNLAMTGVAVIATDDMLWTFPFYRAVVMARDATTQHLTMINRNLRTPHFGRMARFASIRTSNVAKRFPLGPHTVMTQIATTGKHTVIGRSRRPRRG